MPATKPRKGGSSTPANSSGPPRGRRQVDNIDEKLKKLGGKKFAEAKKKALENPDVDGDFTPYDFLDGNYIGRLNKVKVKQGKKQFGASFEYVVCSEGDGYGEKHWHWRPLESQEDLERCLKYLRRFELEGLDEAEDATIIAEAAKELTEAKPYVRFELKTNDGGYQNHYLRGKIHPDDLESAGAKLVDDGFSSDDAGDEGEAVETPAKPGKKVSRKGSAELVLEFEDKNVNEKLYDKIAEMAEAAGVPCTANETWIDVLTNLAKEAGVTGKFTTCPNLLAAIEQASGGEGQAADEGEPADEGEEGEPAEGEGEDVQDPVEGDAVEFTPKGKKDPIECSVTSVDTKKKTANLKSADGKMKYSNIAWDRIVILVS